MTPADNKETTKNRTPCNKRTHCKGGEKKLDRTPQQGSYPSPKKIKILFLGGTYIRDMIVPSVSWKMYDVTLDDGLKQSCSEYMGILILRHSVLLSSAE